MKSSYNFPLKIYQEINKDIKKKPENFYYNAQECKSLIYSQNKCRSGIYRWNNLITGETYIGSALDLRKRLCHYYSLVYLKTKRSKISSNTIHNALLKYDHSNFSLDILEYCSGDMLISREQYYMDKLNPEYNISKKAGTPLGIKHSE
jgi:group I intron endonuclease